ncbi:MAG: hypothetical protein Q7T01_03510 [bacterium]|nr:hypothetical protein [bacterium]
MAKKKTPNTRTEKAQETQSALLGDLERFRGMSAERIADVLQTERACYENTHGGGEIPHLVDRIKNAASSDVDQHWGTEAICERMIARAEAEEHPGLADSWYAYLLSYFFSKPDAHRAVRTRRRALFMRAGWPLASFKKHGFTLTDDELLDIARRSYSGHRSEEHRDAYFDVCARCHYRPGLHRLLRDALADGDDGLARRAAQVLGRNLSLKEREKLAHAKMNDTNADPIAITSYLVRAKLPRLARMFLGYCIDHGRPFRVVRAIAKRIRVELSEHQLARLRTAHMREQHVGDVLTITHILAHKYGAPWKSELHATYQWVRNLHLTYFLKITEAEKYGKRCGMPLTLDELTTFIGHVENDDRYNGECDVARALIGQRISAHLGAPLRTLKRAA